MRIVAVGAIGAAAAVRADSVDGPPSHLSPSPAGAAGLSPLPLPPRGWSTWNTFRCTIDEQLVNESIAALASSPLRVAGYEWVLIDDCWTACDTVAPDGSGRCLVPGARDEVTGRIRPNPAKFPRGFEPLTQMAHDHGLKIGIYTSVSAVTCAGYCGSLRHEAVDAAAFVDWGFDFVKHDTCGTDYSVHDGGMQNATRRMRDGLWEAGHGKIVYYLDSGNPTSPEKVFNPFAHHVHDKEAITKLATQPHELAWAWTYDMMTGGGLPSADDGRGPHMVKSWFDVADAFQSTLTNARNQARTAEYQYCGHFNMPDMLTVGMGAQTEGEYRTQFFLWVVLGAPLVMGNDVRNMSSFTVDLVTNPELLAVQADPECVQGSLARAENATETWVRPLSDGTFAVAVVNKGENPATARVFLRDVPSLQGGRNDFFPAVVGEGVVRDLHGRKDIGPYSGSVWEAPTLVPGHDAIVVRFRPDGSADEL